MQLRCVGGIVAARRRRRPWLLLSGFVSLVAFLSVTSSIAFGQGVTGRILGTVQDPSEASIPGANVTVTNQDTGYRAEVPTGSAGDFIVPGLPPGKYKVTVTAKGFKAAESDNVVVIVNGSSRVDFKMQVGSASETIQVQAVAPVVESTSSSMGNDLSTREVDNLPINGRVYSQLVDVMPGAVKTGIGPSAESGSGIGAQGSITASVNGMVYQGTTFTLDGVTDMELENAFQNVTPPMDDIQEVKVSSNNATADVGTYGGAQVNAFIKSGTNSFHGSAFEFFRDRSLDANTWANDFNGVAKPAYESNQYGGSIGGPIKKDKLFFFGGYEGLRLDNGFTYTLTVPSAMLRAGYFPENYFTSGIYNPDTGSSGVNPTEFGTMTLPTGTNGCAGTGATNGSNGVSSTLPSCTVYVIPQAMWDPVAVKMLNGNTIWPAPNAANPYAPTNNFNENITETDPQQKFDVKVDWNLGSQDHAFVRASYQENTLTAPTPTQFIYPSASGDVNAKPRDDNDEISYTHWFSPLASNEFRVGFDRFFTHDYGNDFGSNEDTALGIPNGNLPAFPNTSGMAQMSPNSNQSNGNIAETGSEGYTDSERMTNTYEVVDNFTLIRGKHTFGFGEDYRRLQASVANADHDQSGSFSYDNSYTSSCAGNASCSGASGGAGWADFLLGLPTSLSRDIVNAEPATRLTIADAYFQDDYRATKKFTINLAIRWDLITMYSDKFNHQSNLNINTGLLDVATATNRAPDVGTNYHNFDPRIGFAYTPDNGKTVVRGAWGVTVFTDHYGSDGGTLERNWPWFEEYSLSQQAPNTPWAELSTNQNLPAASVTACTGASGFVSNLTTCVVGLPTYVPQQVSSTVVPSTAATIYYVPQNNQPDKAAMWNFGIQRELTPTSSIDIAYVGTQGTNLFRSINIDQEFPGPNQIYLNGSTTVPTSLYSGLSGGIANSNQANRIYAGLGCTKYDPLATLAVYNPVTGVESDGTQPVCDAGPLAFVTGITERGSTGYSIYHGLQVRYNKRFSHGLETLLSYTWSKEIDDMTVLDPLVNEDQYNRALGDSSAPDVPQNFIASFVYELPFGKGRDWMTNASYPVELLLGGWQTSGIVVIQHGVPLAVSDGAGSNGGLNGGWTNRADYNYSACGSSASILDIPNTQSSTKGIEWFNPNPAYNNASGTTPGWFYLGLNSSGKPSPNYAIGSSVPGNVWGPGIVNFDLSLSKAFRFRESMELKVEIDAFNAFNTPHFSNPGTTCCTESGVSESGFGIITGTASPPRILQLGAHFAF